MMEFHNLQKVWHTDIARWLEDELELTQAQKEKLRGPDYEYDMIRFSEFKFYREKEVRKTNIIFRATAPLFAVYWVILFLSMPIKWLITGSSRYKSENLKFYHSWCDKLGI